MSAYPTERYPTGSLAVRRRRSRLPAVLLIVAAVLGVLAVIADRAAAAYTENRFATQIQSQGFPTKPHVSISGFPFLTQVLGRDFHNVHITADNVVKDPVQISHLDVSAREMRFNSSFNGGTIDRVDGSGLITFADFTNAVGQPQLTLTAAGANEVKANVDLGITQGTATAKVEQVSRDEIRVHAVSFSVADIPLSQLGQQLDFTVKVPSLPMGMSIQGVSVSPQGILIEITGQHLSFHQ